MKRVPKFLSAKKIRNDLNKMNIESQKSIIEEYQKEECNLMIGMCQELMDYSKKAEDFYLSIENKREKSNDRRRVIE